MVGCWLMLVVVGGCWFVLVLVGGCWWLLVVVGCCWVLLVVVGCWLLLCVVVGLLAVFSREPATPAFLHGFAQRSTSLEADSGPLQS